MKIATFITKYKIGSKLLDKLRDSFCTIYLNEIFYTIHNKGEC